MNESTTAVTAGQRPGVTAQVRTTDGWPVGHAVLTVTDSAGQQVARVTAGEDGELGTEPLPAGTYTALLTAPGFGPAARTAKVTASGSAVLGVVELARSGGNELPKPGIWTIDPAHSAIHVTARHLGMADLIGKLNEIRHARPAARQLRIQRVHPTSDPALVCFSRHLPAHLAPDGVADTLVVVVNLDPAHTREGTAHLDPVALDLPEGAFEVEDLLGGGRFTWSADPFVRLDPALSCAHVMRVVRP